MLGYYINNKPLAIEANSSVRIIYYNPACFFDEIPGDVALGIEMPNNEVNAAILGNPERFAKYSMSSTREFPGFEIRFGGKTLISGTLIIQSADKDSYSGWCRNNVGNLGKAHRDKYIYDIPAFMQNKTFVNKANYNPLTDPYGCPTHYNPDFFRDKGHVVNLTKKVPNPDYVDLSWWQDLWHEQQPAYLDEFYKIEAFTEAFRRSAALFVNHLNPDKTVQAIGSTALIKRFETDLFVNVISPMLFLNFILEMLFRDAKFFIDKNAIKDSPDMQKLILYNNFDITKVEFTTKFITETIPAVETVLYTIPAVTYTVGSIQDIKRSYDGTFQYRDLLPKIKLRDFILSIQNLLNVCFHFHGDGKVDIIDREAAIDSVPIDIDKYLVNGWNIGERKDVTLKFLFSHDNDDSMFSEKWIDIDDRRLDEKDPVQTADELELIENPVFGEIRYIVQSNTYAEYAWVVEPQIDPATGDEVPVNIVGWKHLSTGFQNGFFNRNKNEEEQIKTDFSTLFGDQTTHTLHKGNMETIKLAYENFTPRLMFYLGNNQAKSETANLALDWEKKDKGLLAKRWPKWNRFWAQRHPVTIDAAFSINMLDYVSRNITNRFRCREGDFIIETMETEFNLNSIGDTKLTGYKNSFTPAVVTIDQHWNWNNLIMDDTLLDFDNVGLILDTDLDLFPFGQL
jgi:hypothetical protein